MIADIEISKLPTVTDPKEQSAKAHTSSKIISWEDLVKKSDLSVVEVPYQFSQSVTWADEFNYTGAPDPAKWSISIGNGYYGWGNHEQQYFTDRPENVKVEDGKLKITARVDSYEGYEYTSGKVVSKKRHRYGRYIINAKMPLSKGLWPAIFGFGERHKVYDLNSWPRCGEFDIVEIKGQHDRQVNYNVHSANSSGASNMVTLPTPVSLNQFNEYRIDWTPDYIKWYFNGKLMRTFSKSGKGYDGWPFDDEFDLNICLNTGGDFVGNNIDRTALPASMEIEYIRYFALTNVNKKNAVVVKPIQPILEPASAEITTSQSQTFRVTNVPANTTVHWYARGVDLASAGFSGPQITVTPAMLQAGGISSGASLEFFVDFVDAKGVSGKATRGSLSIR